MYDEAYWGQELPDKRMNHLIFQVLFQFSASFLLALGPGGPPCIATYGKRWPVCQRKLLDEFGETCPTTFRIGEVIEVLQDIPAINAMLIYLAKYYRTGGRYSP